MIGIRNILVATDFGEPAEAALRYGEELARKFGATLHVLHVVDDVGAHATVASGLPMALDDVQKQMEADAWRSLESLVPEPDRSAYGTKLVVLTSTAPAATILSYARDTEIDLVIVGTHGRHGLSHFFLGSVAQQVSRSAACPVLTVRAHAREFIKPDALQQAVIH
ncbi:MAG TPA: universal stress protein [Vicinamibacterales bacterium]|nr:universal stress protein [Vicinamibacterales bacterium]